MIKTLLTEVEAFFKANLSLKPNKYVMSEFPDVDVNKEPTVIYIETPDFEFEELTNESKEMKGTLDLYVIFQKNTQDKLKCLSLDYLEAIYLLIKDNPSMNGIVDYSMISNAKVYDGVEGSPNVRGIYIKIEFVKEI